MIDLLMFIVGIVVFFWLIGNAMGLLLMIFVAGLVGFAAESIVPGRGVGYGWLGAAGAGLIGAWIGQKLIGHVGPTLVGVQIVPALVGAVILVFVVSFLRRRA
jgi:uncharacterized membrane protein YeaQ/YmgE (transglycosylase-associated protein family)